MVEIKNIILFNENINNYLDFNKTVIENGEKYRDGEGSDFDQTTQHKNNIALIESSTNIQSMVWDDITGQGSFADSLDQHPDFINVFNAMNKKDGLSNAVMIGMYDTTDDGVVDFRDFIDFDSPESRIFYTQQFDKNQDGKISDEELSLIMKDEFASKAILDITKSKLKDAITKTDHPNYNEDLTKTLVADFLTNRQKQMFYGQEGDKYLKIIPDLPKGSNPESNVEFNEKKGTLTIGTQKITSLDTLKEAGGSYGYLKSKGFTYDDTNDKWFYNPAFSGGTYIKPTADNLGNTN